MTKTEIELKSEIEKLKLINVKMRNCLNCVYYTLIKPVWESLVYDEDMRIYGEQIIVDEVCWTYRIFGLTDIIEKDYIVISNGKVRKRIDKMLDYASQYPTYQIAEIIKGQNPYKMAMHRREKKINLLDIETEFKKYKGGKVC